jgi:KDO2-lipid IV(A) lauroyltransferase
MFRRRRNALLNAIQIRGRQYAAHISFPSDDVRSMVKALRQKAVVWYAPDQCYSSKGSIVLSHFGRPAYVSTATCRIARMSGATIVPFSYYRKSDDSGYVLRFEPAVEQVGTDEECTEHLLATLEELIAQHPEQYAWTPNRLRHSGVDHVRRSESGSIPRLNIE